MSEQKFFAQPRISLADVYMDERVEQIGGDVVVHFVNETAQQYWYDDKKRGVKKAITRCLIATDLTLQDIENNKNILLTPQHIYYKAGKTESVLLLETLFGSDKYLIIMHRLRGNNPQDYSVGIIKDGMFDREKTQVDYILSINNLGEVEYVWEKNIKSNNRDFMEYCALLESVGFDSKELNF